MKDKQLYTLQELHEMLSSTIWNKKINKIVATSNYDKEDFTEYFIAEKISPSYLKSFMTLVDENRNSEDNPVYFKAATEDYELYVFDPNKI